MNIIASRYTGKIFSVIQQEGFFGGLKKILTGFFFVLRPVGSGDILFISSGAVGDSSRYRVRHVAEELKMHGFRCSFTVQEHPALFKCADRFKIFIFHKTTNIPQIARLVERIKAQKKEIIFETDDLVFDPKYIKKQDFFSNSNAGMKKFYEKGLGVELANDPYVKTCTVSTSFLAEKLRELGKQVFVVANKLSLKDELTAEKILETLSSGKKETVRIGYFSGTHSHNRDFATITGALMQIMEKYNHVELFLVGPLDVESSLNKFSDRIKQFSFVPREKHFANIASVDINIVPLEIGNPFCEARSELKFFEAAIMKVPTIAAATQTYRGAIEDGVTGFLAENELEWTEKLGRLIEDENLRCAMGERAREKTLKDYTNKNSHNEEYYNYLRTNL